MNDFQRFLHQTNIFLQNNKIEKNDIAYINLSDKYHMNFNDFFSLTEKPKIWENFRKNYLGTWDVPCEFKIVMRDYSWIEYHTNWYDEFYNNFILHKPPIRAPKRFFLQRKTSTTTMADHIANAMNKKLKVDDNKILIKITLLDIHEALGDAWDKNKRNVPIDVKILKRTNVESLEFFEGLAFVSPSNSLLFMDGGIDQVYMNMFPGIEPKVKAEGNKRNQKTFLGRHFLPIGQAIVVPTDKNNTYIVSAPTMFLPLDVSETHNAYHSTYAALKAAIECKKITHIVFPGMATGIGKVPVDKAAKDMWDAIEDALSGRPAKYNESQIVEDQPPVYACKEYFETYGAQHKIRKIIGV